MKAVSGISVKKSLQIDEQRTISAIMDEVKNMLDYKVGHYVRQDDLTYVQKQNILRSFDGSQQGRHLYEFVSSTTVSLQVVFLLFNIASYCLYELVRHTVDISANNINVTCRLRFILINSITTGYILCG